MSDSIIDISHFADFKCKENLSIQFFNFFETQKVEFTDIFVLSKFETKLIIVISYQF